LCVGGLFCVSISSRSMAKHISPFLSVKQCMHVAINRCVSVATGFTCMAPSSLAKHKWTTRAPECRHPHGRNRFCHFHVHAFRHPCRWNTMQVEAFFRSVHVAFSEAWLQVRCRHSHCLVEGGSEINPTPFKFWPSTLSPSPLYNTLLWSRIHTLPSRFFYFFYLQSELFRWW